MSSSFRLFLVLLLGALMMGLAWVGYVGSDDHSYARGAIGWLHEFPYVGTDHWTLRHTVVIPIAISLALIGPQELSLALPSAALFLVLLAATHRFAKRFFGDGVAFLASLLLASTPLFVVQATFPQNTVVLTLTTAVSFILFSEAARRERPTGLMLAAGVAAGLAWMTLEITAALVLFYALLFVVGSGVRRRYFWSLAVGLAAVVSTEVAYFTAMTGDPFYRYRVDLSHDMVDRLGDAARALRAGHTLNLEGNLAVHPALDPVIGLLANQEFGLLFWLYMPAAIWMWRARDVPPAERRLLQWLSGLGLIWMGFVSLNFAVLYVVPRYYGVFTWTAVIVVAYWLRALYAAGRRGLAALAVAGLIAGNLVGIYVENKNPLYAERLLVALVARESAPVYTDPMTLTRARLLLEFSGLAERVKSGPPPPGALFYANPRNVERCRRAAPKCRWRWQDYLPGSTWTEVRRIEPDRKLAGLIFRTIGLDRFVPTEIFDRIDHPDPTVVLYRLPA